MSDPQETLVFRARALAQAHPLSPAAHRYVNRVVARERVEQPQTEIGIWAGHAITAGYCLRRLEEVDVVGHKFPVDDAISFAALDENATRIAAAVRTSGAEHHHLLPEETVIAALDDLIGGEIDRRLEHWKDTVTAETWSQLEDYLAWWVVKGYALRIAETAAVDVEDPAKG